MRDANRDELFQHDEPESPHPAASASDAIVPWRDALTLLLTGVAFMCVAANVTSSGWVRDLPSLYPIGLSALLIAYGLSRVRWNQLLLLPAGILAGATIIFLQVMAIASGDTLYLRTHNVLDRMYVWWSAVTHHGRVHVDTLPVIIIMLTMTWLGSFLAAWAIFRWRTAIIGLIPGAAALIWDAAFDPNHFSVTSLIYLLVGVLLIMRLRVARQERTWDRNRIAYPKFITFSVLNATFWATCAILSAVWFLPLGQQSAAANARWDVITAPLTSHLGPVARAFISINPDKGANIHGLRDELALQGAIDPSSIPAVQITGDIPIDAAPFLRDQSFQQYARDGWHVNAQGDTPLAPGIAAPTDPAAASASGADPARAPVTIKVKVETGNGSRLFSLGQPLWSDQSTATTTGAAPADVSSLKPDDHISNGSEYVVTGSVNAATIEQLRAAGADYPSWVTDSYLQLSRRLPARVSDKAQEVTAGTANPYDAATAIEAYIRTFPIDLSVPAAPDRRDSVDYFLFDAKRGYFDYHASAMAVMLRTLGIPARIATGYVIDPKLRQAGTDTYNLTYQQTFAWPEVYFPNIGWVEFNPTPSEPVVSRPAAPLPPADQSQLAALARAAQAPASAPSDGSGTGFGIDIRAIGARTWFDTGVVALLALLVAGASGALYVWEFRLRGLGTPAKLWEKSLRLAALGHTQPEPFETPREFADRLGRTVPGTDGVAYIASTYERARFGNKQLSADEARRLRTAWTSARAALVRRLVHWQRPIRE